MRIIVGEHEHVVIEWEAAQALLQKRDDRGMNEFILRPDTDGAVSNPMLVVTVNGDRAYAHYYPPRDHAGFYPNNGASGGNASGFTDFICGGEISQISHECIITLCEAMSVAKEFFQAPLVLPQSIKWLEL